MGKRVIRLTPSQLAFLREIPADAWASHHQPQRTALRRYGLIGVVELDNGDREIFRTEPGLSVVESGAEVIETTHEEITRIRDAAVAKWANLGKKT